MTQECGRLAGLVAFAIGIALCVSACISPRGQEARDLLADIAAGGGPSRLKETAPEPSRVTITYRRAAGPALLAASQTPAGRHVRFIVAIGGYYDIETAIAFVTTGFYRAPDGSWQHAAPNEWGKWVFVRGNADRVGNPADRDRLRRIA